MKFTLIRPKKWDTRTINRFALFPIRTRKGNEHEIRWLEFVTIEQEYFGGIWWNECFVDDEK